MKRLLWIIPLVAVVFAVASTAWSHQPPALESHSWTHVEVATDRPGFESFQKECEDAWRQTRTTLQTYVHTVITIVRAVFSAILTVLVSIAKLVVRFAFAVVLIVARWLFGAFLPL